MEVACLAILARTLRRVARRGLTDLSGRPYLSEAEALLLGALLDGAALSQRELAHRAGVEPAQALRALHPLVEQGAVVLTEKFPGQPRVVRLGPLSERLAMGARSTIGYPMGLTCPAFGRLDRRERAEIEDQLDDLALRIGPVRRR